MLEGKVERSTQHIIGVAFALIILAAGAMDFADAVQRFGGLSWMHKPEAWMDTCLPIQLALMIFYLYSAFSRHAVMRYAQAFVFMCIGYLAIIEAYGSFWGWGFLLVSVQLLSHYGFWRKRPLPKIAACIALTVAVAIFAIRDQHAGLSVIVACISSFIFLFGSFFFINRSEMSRIFSTKKDLQELSESLLRREAELHELEAKLKSHEDPTDSTRMNLDLENAILLDDLEVIRAFIESLESLEELTEREQDLLVDFFIHRGSLTNQELAFDLNVSTDSIKQRFKTIYRKLNVCSRTELYAFLSEKAR